MIYTNKTSCFGTDLKNLSPDRRPELEGFTYAVFSWFEANPGLFSTSVWFSRWEHRRRSWAWTKTADPRASEWSSKSTLAWFNCRDSILNPIETNYSHNYLYLCTGSVLGWFLWFLHAIGKDLFRFFSSLYFWPMVERQLSTFPARHGPQAMLFLLFGAFNYAPESIQTNSINFALIQTRQMD